MIGLAVRVGIAAIIVAGIGGGSAVMAGSLGGIMSAAMVIGITFGLMFVR
jgi:hypothetical protein